MGYPGRVQILSFASALAVVCALDLLGVSAPAQAREQYQMNHPAGQPPQAPVGGANPFGMVPKFSPDFWRVQLANRVPAGTVLSGILENDLSSGKNKAGDIFEVKLQDGFVVNGVEVVPRNSKIIGHVSSAVPAKALRHGHPGKLTVSLQTLVTPDGRSVPFHGFIDQNPNHLSKQEPPKRHAGHHFSDIGQSVASFAGSFTSGIGVVLNKRHRGLDFQLDKGEVLPIRLNRSLDMPAAGAAQAGSAPAVPGLATGTAAGVPGPAPIAAPAAQNQPAVARQFVPGLVGPDPDAPPVVTTPTAAAPPAVPPAAVEDPNAIFQQSLRPRPLADMPDPF
ncbi:MAG TPA: hypothetical protein V6D08_13800 [Candidatus Obscuribacterales bacterium]